MSKETTKKAATDGTLKKALKTVLQREKTEKIRKQIKIMLAFVRMKKLRQVRILDGQQQRLIHTQVAILDYCCCSEMVTAISKERPGKFRFDLAYVTKIIQ